MKWLMSFRCERGFGERLKEEADRLAASEDEEQAMRWVEGATSDLDLPPYDWGEDGPPTGKGPAA